MTWELSHMVMGGHPQGTILKIARKKARDILKNIKSDLQL